MLNPKPKFKGSTPPLSLLLVLLFTFSINATIFSPATYGRLNPLPHLIDQSPRDDFDATCGPNKPCSNGACCGPDGWCGYGPDFCGTGCISNCNAKAECGRYANPPGKTEHGFSCQSNCVEHPQPPPGSPQGRVLSRVIGYYEAWNAFSNCRRTLPSDLPLDALTHVNYAFTFLDPVTYEVTPMDGSTSTQLFHSTTAIKKLKPGLEVWASLGGWTFSDNHTVTQPLLGDIARSAAKRQQFANHVLRFLDTYSFDGIDIDWEYPGASDRGGRPEDVPNFVLLMKTLRETLNKSPRRLGISFTVPASLWYLRWFDVPGLLQYSDFTNIMSYDLHGTWDRDNALGNIIRPHTNLTEIKLACELLWRVGVKPSQVSLGFGFYGRSFTLADPSCSTPGSCRFSDGGAPGKCTASPGYLGYYEIQDIIAQNPGITIHHDQEAAIKHITWSGNQWIAYDDADTFKQKVDWANSVGFSGSLIWASDLDDNMQTAHQGLTGKTVTNNDRILAESNALYAKSELQRSFNTQCEVKECVKPDVYQPYSIHSYCNPGDTLVGFDNADCPDSGFKPICCPVIKYPSDCIWRGGGSDCNGQCHEDTSTCRRGSKAFCCKDPSYDRNMRMRGCRWTVCNGHCQGLETEMAKSKCGFYHERLCCMNWVDTGPALKNCHWVGRGDCADNTCSPSEVTVKRSTAGDGAVCAWFRQKSLCCTADRTTEAFMCRRTYCDIYPWDCPPDTGYDDNPPEDEFTPEIDSPWWANGGHDELRRAAADSGDELPPGLEFVEPDGEHQNLTIRELNALEKRAPSRREYVIWVIIDGKKVKLTIRALPYPGPSKMFNGKNGRTAYKFVIRQQAGTCATTSLETLPAMANPNGQEERYEADHPIELQYMQWFLEAVTTSRRPDGTKLPTNIRLNNANLKRFMQAWNGGPSSSGSSSHGISAGLFPRPASNVPVIWDRMNLNDRMFSILGSNYNRAPFRLIPRTINNMKGKVFALQQPFDLPTWLTTVGEAAEADIGEEDWLEPLREIVSIWRYLWSPEVLPTIQRQRRQMRQQMATASVGLTGLNNLADIWEDFDINYWYTTAQHTREFLRNAVQRAAEVYERDPEDRPANWDRVTAQLDEILYQMDRLQDPGYEELATDTVLKVFVPAYATG
ncbi:hypothetical protein V8F06_008537 [Rhypophila decipiens]